MSSSEDKNEALLDSFQAVARGVEVEYVVQRSRFIGFACYCDSTQKARQFLNDRANLFRSANHHCYAWIIDPEKGEHHYSDDQEPSGSAGRPIYHTLLSFDLRRTLVVVSRFFGGIKLGVRGLIDAYSHTAKLAIQRGGISVYTWGEILTMELDYPHWDAVKYDLQKMALAVDENSITYGSHIRFSVFVPDCKRDQTNPWIERYRGMGADMKVYWQGKRVLRGQN